jgi:hypothetical protein
MKQVSTASLWVGVRLVLGHGRACNLGMCVIDKHHVAECTFDGWKREYVCGASRRSG